MLTRLMSLASLVACCACDWLCDFLGFGSCVDIIGIIVWCSCRFLGGVYGVYLFEEWEIDWLCVCGKYISSLDAGQYISAVVV